MSPSHNAEIVKELNGQAQVIESDFPASQGPKVDPLEVTTESQTAIQKHDGKFATRNGGKGYAVTIRGFYYGPSPIGVGKHEKREYEIEVNVPKLEGALSVIVKNLLMPALLRIDSTAIGVQTHEITNTRPLSANTPESRNIQYMNRDGLVAHIGHDNIPIDHTEAEYADVVVLRDAVMDYTYNPEGFAEREAKRSAIRADKAELLALNPDLAPSSPVAEPKLKVKPKAKAKPRTKSKQALEL